MHAFFAEIFEFHKNMNIRTCEILKENPVDSMAPILRIFSHMINAHQIWNARILKRTELEVWKSHSLFSCCELNDVNFATTLEILDSKPLSEEVHYKNSRGEKYVNSVQEILYHLVNHHSHHRGQLATAMRKLGIAPGISDYIFYKRSS